MAGPQQNWNYMPAGGYAPPGCQKKAQTGCMGKAISVAGSQEQTFAFGAIP
jgi:hypothetical protein